MTANTFPSDARRARRTLPHAPSPRAAPRMNSSLKRDDASRWWKWPLLPRSERRGESEGGAVAQVERDLAVVASEDVARAMRILAKCVSLQRCRWWRVRFLTAVEISAKFLGCNLNMFLAHSFMDPATSRGALRRPSRLREAPTRCGRGEVAAIGIAAPPLLLFYNHRTKVST